MSVRAACSVVLVAAQRRAAGAPIRGWRAGSRWPVEAQRDLAAGACRRGGASQLQPQAFIERARRDPGRVEALHQLERRGELLGLHVVLVRQQRGELVEGSP